MARSVRSDCVRLCAQIALGILLCAIEGTEVRGVEPEVILQPNGESLVGDPITLRVIGLPSNTEVLLFSELIDREGQLWTGASRFQSDADGIVDPSKRAPTEAAWNDIDPLGPFWSLRRKTLPGTHPPPLNGAAERITFSAIVDGEPVDSASAIRRHSSIDIQELPVEHSKLIGRMFAPSNQSHLPGIVVVPGSDGGIPSQLARRLASHGYATLALAYFGEPTLPAGIDLVPLEYIDLAIDWFAEQPFVDSQRIGFVGYSKGGELSLLVGSRRKDLKVIVAGVPSTFVFQSVFGQWRQTSSWSVAGEGLPFVQFVQSERYRQTRILADMYRDSLKTATDDARIPLEDIQAKVLIITGKQDQSWPCYAMVSAALATLEKSGKDSNFTHLSYDDVGHEVFAPGYRPVMWTHLESLQGPAKAQADAWSKAIRFLEQHLMTEEP